MGAESQHRASHHWRHVINFCQRRCTVLAQRGLARRWRRLRSQNRLPKQFQRREIVAISHSLRCVTPLRVPSEAARAPRSDK